MSDENIFLTDDENKASIAERMIADFERKRKRTLYPGDPLRLLILWEADIIEQIYVLIELYAKRNILKYAKGSDLDLLADMFRDEKRLPESPAFTTLRFTISATQTYAVSIPKGTRAAVGEIIFETDETAFVPGGQLYADVHARCSLPGYIGNDFLPGQINTMVDIFSFLENVSNTTKSEGGADEESNEAFYERINKGFESYTNAGSMGAYEYFALSASTLIRDAKAYSDEPGVVKVKVLLSGGVQPGDEMISLVENKLSAEKTRPLTDSVVVSGPDQIGFEIKLIYYVSSKLELDPETIKDAVSEAVDNYIKWQTEAMGRSVNPSELMWRLKGSGIIHAGITEPVFRQVQRMEVAYLSNAPEITFGGVKDD